MKISPITNILSKNYVSSHQKDRNYVASPLSKNSSITFGLSNSSKLKQLYSYGIPCMYSGVEMIDPPKFTRDLKCGYYSSGIRKAVKHLSNYSDSFLGNEKLLFQLLKLKSFFSSKISLKDAVQSFTPFFEKLLVAKQLPKINQLYFYGKELPIDYQSSFEQLLENAHKKLLKQSVIEPFSTTDFKYKLKKISSDAINNLNPKGQRALKKIVSVSDDLSQKTRPETLENQKKVINLIGLIIKSSELKQNEQVVNLIEISKKRLNGESVTIPFSRKAFLYDINQLLENLPNSELKSTILDIASSLPKSGNSFSAYIVKISKEPSEKIAYRLAWPYFASIEHIHPQSCGGKDKISNYGGACSRENSDRQNISFLEQLKRRPKTPKYCQKAIYRMLKLKDSGIFTKINFSEDYIEQFAKAVENESQGKVKLRTTKPWYYNIIKLFD